MRGRVGVHLSFAAALTMVLMVVGCAFPVGAQDVNDATPIYDPAEVTVDGVPIVAERVARALHVAIGERRLDDETRRRLQREIVEQLIDQRLILQALTRQGRAAGTHEVQLEWDLFTAELARVAKPLDDYWKQHCSSEAIWREETAWRISWRRYVDDYWTDDRLRAFFESHRRDFDGTELRVAQILLDAGNSDEELQSALQRIEEIRADLMAGRIRWSQAVQQHSIAPSRVDDGDLGWIRRYGPMPEAFSECAFRLSPGEFSAPFVSPFGVHLIKCLEVKPGKFLFGDVREDVRRAAVEARFREWAAELRGQAEIIYGSGRASPPIRD